MLAENHPKFSRLLNGRTFLLRPRSNLNARLHLIQLHQKQGRYLPHEGAREVARRLRQIQKGMLYV